jgi:hypothetical protein
MWMCAGRFACRCIIFNKSGRLQAVEPELPILVCLELAPQIVLGLVFRVENVVFPVRGRLPHVEDCIRDAASGICVLDGAVEEGKLAVGGHVLHAAGTELPEWCIR